MAHIFLQYFSNTKMITVCTTQHRRENFLYMTPCGYFEIRVCLYLRHHDSVFLI